MRKPLFLAFTMVLSISTFVYCADLYISQKRHRFQYEVVKLKKAPPYVVQQKPYRKPLVVGFKVNPDDTIKALDTKDAAEDKGALSPASVKTEIRDVAAPKNIIPDPTLKEQAAEPSSNSGQNLVERPALPKTSTIPSVNKTQRKKIFTVYFKRGSSLLGTNMVQSLRRFSITIPESRFEVRGFTCPLGSMEINQRLARQRSETVARKIRAMGGKVEKVIGKPMCCYQSQTDYTMNRRAEIYLITDNERGAGS